LEESRTPMSSLKVKQDILLPGFVQNKTSVNYCSVERLCFSLLACWNVSQSVSLLLIAFSPLARPCAIFRVLPVLN
jgi:hypothetical protein